MLRVAGRDIRAFELIYERYSAQAFGLAMYITGRRGPAEEVTQDAFLGLWRAASGYDPRRGTLKTWLLSVVRNRGIDSLRAATRHGRDVEIDDAVTAQLQSPERTEEQVADRDESRYARGLLTSLPTEQRQVVELAFFKGLTQTEIAARLGLPLGTVKGRQRLALRKLHARLVSERPAAISHVTRELA